jgi:hypothetical protein
MQYHDRVEAGQTVDDDVEQIRAYPHEATGDLSFAHQMLADQTISRGDQLKTD